MRKKRLVAYNNHDELEHTLLQFYEKYSERIISCLSGMVHYKYIDTSVDFAEVADNYRNNDMEQAVLGSITATMAILDRKLLYELVDATEGYSIEKAGDLFMDKFDNEIKQCIFNALEEYIV